MFFPLIHPLRKSEFTPWIFLSFCLFVITAAFSEGFFYYDEQFQILEFLSFKLGRTPANEMVWEFHEQVRPWIQPGFYYLVSKISLIFGNYTGLQLALLMRFVTAALSFVSMWAFALTCVNWIEKSERKLLVVLFATIWFFPYLHVRTSSECFSEIFLFLGLAIAFAKRPPKSIAWALVGFFWALAYGSRYQTGIAVLGIGLWFIVFRKISFRNLLFLAFGFLLGVGLGVMIDRWGYGVWQFTAWKYFSVNLLQGKAAEFGVSPFWEYAVLIVQKANPILGFLLLVLVFRFWILHPKHPLSWLTFPFFLIHCFISHKELRFLFPLSFAIPPIVVVSLRELTLNKGSAKVIYGILTVAFLLPVTFLPVRTEMASFHAIEKHHCKTLAYIEKNPYSLGGLSTYFYRPQEIEVFPWVPERKADCVYIPKEESSALALKCDLVAGNWISLPHWVRQMDWMRRLISNLRVASWSLYACDK